MTKQEIIIACVNKELEPYGITYDNVKRGGDKEVIEVIEKGEVILRNWFFYYTFNSIEEYNNWKDFCISLFRKELKLSKKAAEKEFMYFDLNYGLNLC